METPDTALREQITAAYAPLVALYQLFEGRLREAPDDRPPVGWKPQLDALRALRDGETDGDWTDLTRLMVDPAALAPPDDSGDPHVLLIRSAGEPAAVAALAERLCAAHRRILLLAPTAGAAHRVLQADQGHFTVIVEPEDDPPPGAAPETWVREARLRPYGSAYQDSWLVESRRLQRDLLWLEQWPRDRAALEVVRAGHERRAQEFAAEDARLAGELARLRDEAATAELAAAVARRTRDGLAEELRRAEGAVAGLGEEYEEFRRRADEAAGAAAEATRVAEEAYARYAATEESYANCVRELETAKQREAFLIDELPRAKAALPEAESAVAQAAEVLAAAEADGHASYYRLAAAESAMAAEKQKMSVSQRLHLRPARPEAQGVRQQLAGRRREADEAATRAQEARGALEKATAYRAAVAEVITNGERELVAARETQERLEEEVVRLAAERDPAKAEHEEHARLAAEAVGDATDQETAARQADQRLLQGKERLDKARAAHAEATAAAEGAEATARTTAAAATVAETELPRRRAEVAAAREQAAADLQAEIETEERSHGHVTLLCGEDPDTVSEEILTEHRDRAMARIEELSGYLDGDVPAEVLLLQADVVCATPAALAACPAARCAGYDTLIAVEAGRLTDGEFLVAAVHARHWILIGDDEQTPPPPGPVYVEHLHALAELAALPEDAAPDPTAEEDRPQTPDPTIEDRIRSPDAIIEDRPKAVSAVDITLEDRPSGTRGEERPEPLPSDPDATLEDRPPTNGVAGAAGLPGLSPEARRIRDLGLWEARYRAAYEKALRRLEQLNGSAEHAEPAQILTTVLEERLNRGLFERCVRTAPQLIGPVPS